MGAEKGNRERERKKERAKERKISTYHFPGLELGARVLGEPDGGDDPFERLRDVCQRVVLGRSWRKRWKWRGERRKEFVFLRRERKSKKKKR